MKTLSPCHERMGKVCDLYRCGECGWAGIPTFEDGHPYDVIDVCPRCGEGDPLRRVPGTVERWRAENEAPTKPPPPPPRKKRRR